jgi:hypothetical protein
MASRNPTGLDCRTPNGTTAVDPVRLADLIATGEMSWPLDLDDENRRLVAELVRRRRAERLVRHLARLIAAAIQSGRLRRLDDDQKPFQPE